MMDKIIVLHDNVNGKRRVVKVLFSDMNCEACSIRAINTYCELLKANRVNMGCELFEHPHICGFKDVFNPEDL